MENSKLVANVIVLTTAISSLLTLFRPDQQLAFKNDFEKRITSIIDHSLGAPMPDEWIAEIEKESAALIVAIFLP